MKRCENCKHWTEVIPNKIINSYVKYKKENEWEISFGPLDKVRGFCENPKSDNFTYKTHVLMSFDKCCSNFVSNFMSDIPDEIWEVGEWI